MLPRVTSWGFLTNHGRVLLCIARDPGVRLRDIADRLGITERSAHGIVTDLTEAGYVVKHKDGRRNRYQIQAHMPLPEPASQEPAIGEVLALLTGAVIANDGTPMAGDGDASVRPQALAQAPQPADQ
jgi:MarR family